eukprot:1145603-Pelagomonas_calceolata.AAC.3
MVTEQHNLANGKVKRKGKSCASQDWSAWQLNWEATVFCVMSGKAQLNQRSDGVAVIDSACHTL